MIRSLLVFVLAVGATMASPLCASASIGDFTVFTFQRVRMSTADTTLDTDSLGNSITLRVTDRGPDGVDFKFVNGSDTTLHGGSISDIYFDDGAYLVGPAAFIAQSGSSVAFVDGASPITPTMKLNGDENSYYANQTAISDWESSAEMYAKQSENPDVENGLESGESLTVRYGLVSTVDYADVVAGLQIADNGPFRVAIRVKGINDSFLTEFLSDDAESNTQIYVLNPQPFSVGSEVPEPATLAIWGLGLGIAGLVRLRRKTVA